MKKKLYDFSVGMGFAAIVSFAILFYFFGYHWKNGGSFVYALLFVLSCAGFVFLIYWFVFHAATLEDEGIRYGRLFIPRENLKIRAEYDERFRESVYYLQDSRKDYTAMELKEADRARIRLEATHGTRKKLEAYTGLELIPEGKPSRRRRSRF